MRKILIQIGQFYHIFNRGVDKRIIFKTDQDYFRFLQSLKEFNDIKPVGSLWLINQRKRLLSDRVAQNFEPPGRSKRSIGQRLKNPLVEIICFSLLPNHFHLLLRQLEENGISKFLKNLCGGYSNYFNKQNQRSGSLFQGQYQLVHIESDEQLLYLSSYINGNPEIHKIAKADKYKWSSYSDYLSQTNYGLCNKDIILKEFKNINEYKKYTTEVMKGSGSRKEEKKRYLLE